MAESHPVDWRRFADHPRIWPDLIRLSRCLGRAQAASPTQSYQEIYEKSEVQEHLADVERGIDARSYLK